MKRMPQEKHWGSVHHTKSIVLKSQGNVKEKGEKILRLWKKLPKDTPYFFLRLHEKGIFAVFFRQCVDRVRRKGYTE